MTLDAVLKGLIGPYGALIGAVLVIVYLWRALAEQKEATRTMEHQRDHWRDLYYLAIVGGERTAAAEQAVAAMLPAHEAPAS